jgi:hypothetical protein
MKIIKYKKVWQYFFISKIIYMLFALFIYSKLTSLGDTFSYLNGSHYNIENVLWSSTSMMGVSGFYLARIFGNVLANIPYLILAFYGIYYSVSRIHLTKKELIYLLLFLSLPSFGVWTSISSKESIGVFFMGILAGYIFDLYYKKRTKIKLIEFLAVYIGILFKPQYLVIVLSIILLLYLIRKFNFKKTVTFILLLLYIFIFMSIFIIFYEEIDRVSLLVPTHFNVDAHSTRVNELLLESGDIIRNAPYGMFISFWGPTFQEVLARPLLSIAFLESLFIVCVFCIFLIKMINRSIITKKINFLLIFLFLSVFILILFVHFPFGFMNPGSALRYRENFYAFFIVIAFFINSEYLKSHFKNINMRFDR